MSRLLQSTDFKSLNIRLIDQTFQYAGDANAVELKLPLTSVSPIKTLLTKGAIKLEVVETGFVAERLTAPGKVLPGPNTDSKTKFKVTALEDDTHIHCVQPIQLTDRIIFTETALVAGQSIDVPKGNLALVFGDNYKVSNNDYSGFRVFAVQNSDAVIQASTTCRVVVFTSVSA